MTRILFLSHSSVWGGAEWCLHRLLRGLPRDRFEPIVLFPESGKVERAIHDLGIRTEILPLTPWVAYSPTDWPAFARLAQGLHQQVGAVTKLLHDAQIDLVVSNTSVVAEGALAAEFAGLPHVWWVHEMIGVDPVLTPVVPLDQFYRLIGHLSQRIVTVSSAVSNEFEEHVAPGKLQVIHTGLQVEEITNRDEIRRDVFHVDENTPVVTFAGLLSRRKGVLDLVKAAAITLKDFPQARFFLAGGDGEAADDVRHFIAQHQLEQSVHLMGFVSPALEPIAASDIFVMPSLSDPLPIAVMEAMSAGIPIVATRSGGCEDMVADGQTGYLVPPQDPQSLAAAINKLLANPKQRREMGRQAKQRLADKFEYDRFIREFSDLFEETAHRKPVEPQFAPKALKEIIALLQSQANQHAERLRLSAELELASVQIQKFETHPLLGRMLHWRRRIRKPVARP